MYICDIYVYSSFYNINQSHTHGEYISDISHIEIYRLNLGAWMMDDRKIIFVALLCYCYVNFYKIKMSNTE